MSPRVTIAIPSIRPTSLQAAIDSIRAQTHGDWELIVVVQGADAQLPALVEENARRDPRVRLLHLERMNASHARNAAIHAARGEIIAFTDDDCEAEPGWLSGLLACFDRDAEVGLVSGALRAPPRPPGGISYCPEVWPQEQTVGPGTGVPEDSVFAMAGANFAVRLDVAKRAGDFDELLGAGAEFFGSEDTDYMLRVAKLGVRMHSTPLLVVNHTYGHRFGVRAALRIRRNYSVGQGALAGKLTLAGDPRGEQWVEMFRKDFTRTISGLRLHATPAAAVRYALAVGTARRVQRHYSVDPKTGVLRLRAAQG